MKIIRSASGCMSSWGLIKELQNSGIEVIGTDSDPNSYGFHLLRKNYLVPRGDNPKFITEILKIIDEEMPNAIISGPEEEVLTLSKNKKRIEENGTVLLCPDYEYVKICADKKETNKKLESIKIPVIEIYKNTDSIEFPCIIKPRFGRGGLNIHIAKNKEELNFYLKQVNEPIIQKFIQGEEYTVDVLADKNGNALSIVPRLRLKIESGISVRGKTIYDKGIIEYCRLIASKLKLFGPSCIQCIKNKDTIKFIEINTRFGGGSILSIKTDSTIMSNLLKLIQGKKPEPSKGFKEGITMLRYYSEVFV